jgi:hypothetical protein
MVLDVPVRSESVACLRSGEFAVSVPVDRVMVTLLLSLYAGLYPLLTLAD